MGATETIRSTSLPWMLRNATRRFGNATRNHLESAGFDLPTSGVWAIRALDGNDQTATELVTVLDLSKQAVSMLVEGLVDAGYVERRPHHDDRRRVVLTLSERGQAAAAAIRAAGDAVTDELASHVSADAIAAFQAVLATLAIRPGE